MPSQQLGRRLTRCRRLQITTTLDCAYSLTVIVAIDAGAPAPAAAGSVLVPQ